VSQRRRAIATAVVIAGFAVGFSPAVARASEASDIQALRREVNRMRAEVEAMQLAVTQANDLERVRNEKLRKALGEPGEQTPPAAPPSGAPAEETEAPSAPPTPAPRAAPASGGEDRSTPKRKRHKRSGRARAKAARAHADGDR
jgi:hypothetical protein